MLIIASVAWWYLRYTAGGRHLYASIGSDATVAGMAGIRVRGRTIFSYALTGLLVGLAACSSGSGGMQHDHHPHPGRQEAGRR